MTVPSSAERERQRFEHLVLGRPRPKPGKARTSRRAKVRSADIVLAPGIEDRVQLRERWSHKANGTPETHEHSARRAARPGSLARLYASGAIDAEQLAAAEQIAAAYWAIARDVTVRTASLETRIDGGRHGRADDERLGAVISDLAYASWRSSVGALADSLLEVIVHDQALTLMAQRHGMGMARARRCLTIALDLWWISRGERRREAKAIVSPS